MKRILILSARLYVGAIVCQAAGQSSLPNADELVAKNIEAKGGLAAIKAITSLRVSGKFETQGIVILLGMDRKPESMVRQTLTIQGMTQVQTYDGSEGWQINPFSGRRDPERMGEDDTREMAESNDFYGPLIDYKQKGSKVEYIGHHAVDGDDALLLKVTLKNGDIVNYLLDPDTYLEIRTEKQMFVHGSVHESFSNLGSYKKVDGVYFPFSIESGSPRSPVTAKITITKMEANLAIPDSEFKMPAAAKSAPAEADQR